MQVSVEKVSNVECRLTIVVPAEKVEKAIDDKIKGLAQKANIKGFRPGKAPLSYITQRFGDDARKEGLGEVIQQALYQALAEHHLRPVSTPSIEPKTLTPHQPFEFIATFEVLPEIGPIQFSMDNVEKLKVELKPEDTDHVIEQLRKQHTKWKPVERAAKEKDQVVIDYHSIFEGQADFANKVERFPLELGSKRMLAGFEEGLIDVKAGEERTLHLNFPTDFTVAEKAGKPVDFVVQVKNVFEAEIPALDSAFYQKLGVKSGNAEDFKEQINQSLEKERDRLIKEKVKEQIFSRLLEQNPLDVPKSLVAREAKGIHDEMYPYQHNHHNHPEGEVAAFQDVAKKRVALGLLINEYAKQHHLKADREKVEQRIADIASIYENPQEVAEWLASNEQRPNIEAQVLEDQVMEKLIEGVAVTEKTMSYADLKSMRT